MSGTSFDGVDAALIKQTENYIEFIHSEFLPFSKKEKTLYKISVLKNYNFLTKAIDKIHKSNKKIIK